MDKLIKEAKDNNNYVLYKAHSPIVPEWQDLLESMDLSYQHYKDGPKEDPRMISSNILIFNKLDPVVFNWPDFKDANLVSAAENTITAIKDIMGQDFSFSKIIMNFVGKEQDYYIHKDDHDVISWHCIGNVEWRFYRNIDDSYLEKTHADSVEYESVILNPGDIMFVPAGLVHQVIIEKPRASLVFGYF
jgi:hypothetical protein